MNKNSTNGGGQFKSANDFQGQEIEFPVTFNLKAVLPASTDKENKKKIENVLANNKIRFAFQTKKVSSKGTYASYTYKVTLESKDKMTRLYDELKKIEDLKFAI